MRDEAERSTRAPHVSAAGPLLSTVDHWLNVPAERQFMVLTRLVPRRRAVSAISSPSAPTR